MSVMMFNRSKKAWNAVLPLPIMKSNFRKVIKLFAIQFDMFHKKLNGILDFSQMCFLFADLIKEKEKKKEKTNMF